MLFGSCMYVGSLRYPSWERCGSRANAAPVMRAPGLSKVGSCARTTTEAVSADAARLSRALFLSARARARARVNTLLSAAVARSAVWWEMWPAAICAPTCLLGTNRVDKPPLPDAPCARAHMLMFAWSAPVQITAESKESYHPKSQINSHFKKVASLVISQSMFIFSSPQ